jgi:hypothetical protein
MYRGYYTLFCLSKSKDELLCGESEGAIDFSDVMILNSIGLLTQIKLEDGTVTTPTEIKFLRH